MLISVDMLGRVSVPHMDDTPIRSIERADRPYEVRKVVSGGFFTWRCQPVFVGFPLIGERIGLSEIEDGLWRVYFADVELGVLDEVQLKGRKTGKVLPMSPV